MTTCVEVLQAITGATPRNVEIAGNPLTIEFDNGIAVVANAGVQPVSGSDFSRRIPLLTVETNSRVGNNTT
jgi:hypothetical protein